MATKKNWLLNVLSEVLDEECNGRLYRTAEDTFEDVSFQPDVSKGHKTFPKTPKQWVDQ